MNTVYTNSHDLGEF